MYLRILSILTGRLRAEAVQEQLNRALRLLSACNMALVRAEDEYKLLDEICRLIVGQGGYRMVWVGYAEPGDGKPVRPAAQAGFEQGYLSNARISWDDGERGLGPTGTSIRTGTVQINQNVLTNPVMAPWRNSAVELGYNASIALPMADAAGVFGALTIYSAEPDAFFPDEVTLLKELAGDLAFGIVTIRDRRKHAEAKEELAFLSAHDPLTRLPNRLLSREYFEQAAASAARNVKQVAVLFLDIDRFAAINDSLGADQGDQLLIKVVERLRGCLRDGDAICRHGGDEFIIHLPAIGDVAQAVAVAEGILAAFEVPFEAGATAVTISFSIGISLFPDDGRDIDVLVKCADSAAREAKDSGRNTYRFFTRNMNVDLVKTMQLRHQMAGSLKNKEFLLHYQPQIDMASGEVIGAEALIRWNHPDLGMVSPGQFIPLAEESGLIVPIGEWVIGEACRQQAAWRRAGLPDLVVAVNLSALQFKRGNVEQSVLSALAEAGIEPSCLELELTESILIKDVETVLATVGRLKNLGLTLSIDDFGTGYSSLTYLKRFKVDKLKIDQSFVRDLISDPEDAAIVRTIIQMAVNLNLRTIAEGVESAEVLSILRDMGCDEAQGYHVARPMPADAFADFLNNYKAAGKG